MLRWHSVGGSLLFRWCVVCVSFMLRHGLLVFRLCFVCASIVFSYFVDVSLVVRLCLVGVTFAFCLCFVCCLCGSFVFR